MTHAKPAAAAPTDTPAAPTDTPAAVKDTDTKRVQQVEVPKVILRQPNSNSGE